MMSILPFVNTETDEFLAEKSLLTLSRAVVLSGILLVPLPVIGLFDLNSSAFYVFWALHLLLFGGCLVLALRAVMTLVRQSAAPDSLIYIACAVLLSAGAFCLGLTPILARDALIYHLAVPSFWLEAGKIHEVPWHEWSYFPLLMSMTYAGLLRFGLEQLTPYYHLAHLFLTAVLTALFCAARLSNPSRGLLALVLCLAVPIGLSVAAEPMADFGAALYFSVAFFLLLHRLSEAEQEPGRGVLLYAGAAVGLSLSCKYSSILGFAVLAAVLLPVFLSRFGVSRTLKSGALVGLVALVVYSPWPVKNFLWTGNPVYPFMGSVFGGSEGLPFFGALKPLPYRMAAYGESLIDFLLIPLRMIFFGEDDNPQYFAGVLNPILIFAVVPVFEFFRRGSEKPGLRIALLVMFFYLYASLLMFYALVRYQILLAAVAIYLTVAGIHLCGESLRMSRRRLWYPGIAVIATVLAVLYLQERTEKLDTWDYVRGELSKEEFLQRNLSEYAVISWVNSHLPEDARIYLLFTGNRYFYYRREVRGAYFSAEPLERFVRAQREAEPSVEELADGFTRVFAEMGVNYLAMHNRRVLEVLGAAFTDREKAAWTLFLKRDLKLLHQAQGMSIWQLKPASGMSAA